MRKIFSFISAIDEDRRKLYVKILGLALLVFAISAAVSTVSYLFNWQADQSLLSQPLNSTEPTGNDGAYVGIHIGDILVCKYFGLGAFAVVAALFVLAVRLIMYRRPLRIFSLVLLTLTGSCILSWFLAMLSSLLGAETAFGGGLGGMCGAAAYTWMSNLCGAIVTLSILAVSTVIWAVFASGSVSRWFMSLGERRAAVSVDEPVSQATEPADESYADSEEADEDPESDDVAVSADIVEEKPSGVREEQSPLEDEEPYDENTDGMEVIVNDANTTDVTKELPRIDMRDELKDFTFPPLTLLDEYENSVYPVSEQELQKNNLKIRAALKTFKIDVVRVTAVVGSTVTLYKVYPAPGVTINAIKNRQDDIAMALNVKGARIVKLSDAVGIELANSTPSIVPLRGLLNSDTFRNSKAELPVAIGENVTKNVKVFDLAEAPHLLVAGATKQGKSVGLNVLITSLLYAKHPSELKFVFIDPKMVEFSSYAHLMYHYLAMLPGASEEDERKNAIAKTPDQAELILRSLCVEMDARYALLSMALVNNVKLYNEKYKSRHLNPAHGHRYMPYIVVVVDEYADLTMSVGGSPEAKLKSRSISTSIIRLAQKGRAAGIHVVLATQRPSVDVVTGLIKTNFPMKIAFRVSSSIDSKTILNQTGAEKLIGRGDMIWSTGIENERIQCAYISGDEIGEVNDYISQQRGYKKSYNTPYYLPLPEEDKGDDSVSMIDMKNLDERFEEAAELVVTTQRGSTSDLQRRLGMGYAKAGRVMDQLEAAGIVGPQSGSKPREVLVGSLDELHRIVEAYKNGFKDE